MSYQKGREGQSRVMLEGEEGQSLVMSEGSGRRAFGAAVDGLEVVGLDGEHGVRVGLREYVVSNGFQPPFPSLS